MPALLDSALDVSNFVSRDLMHSETCIVIAGLHRAITIDATLVDTATGTDEQDAGPFIVLWVCGTIVHVVQYDLSYDFHTAMQCAYNSSGVNYRPLALYTEAELETARVAAETHPDAANSIVYAEVLTLRYAGDDPS